MNNRKEHAIWLLIDIIFFIAILILWLSAKYDANAFEIDFHKTNYAAYGQYEHDDDTRDINFQFSVKTPLFWGINAAYTQKSFWNVSKPSKPFRENNYSPSLFYAWENDNIGTRLGYFHESNGLDAGADNRSLERLFVHVHAKKRWLHFNASREVAFWKAPENKDIIRYIGTWKVRVGFDTDALAMFYTKRLRSGMGEAYIDAKYFYVYLRYFDGYGQGLIDFDKQTIGRYVGVALSK